MEAYNEVLDICLEVSFQDFGLSVIPLLDIISPKALKISTQLCAVYYSIIPKFLLSSILLNLRCEWSLYLFRCLWERCVTS